MFKGHLRFSLCFFILSQFFFFCITCFEMLLWIFHGLIVMIEYEHVIACSFFPDRNSISNDGAKLYIIWI